MKNKPWQNFNFFHPETLKTKPTTAISACLNGHAVRYDGRESLLETTSTILSRYLTLIPICPEVASGMSVPRPPIQLVLQSGKIEALGRDDKSLSVTSALENYRKNSLEPLGRNLCGYIFKSKSPSCGLGTTPIFNTQGEQIDTGSGLQAAFVQQHYPWLQLADETALQQSANCHQFIFRCILLLDLQLGCQDKGLLAVNTHYQFLIKKMSCYEQNALQDHTNNNEMQCYWIALLKGIEHTWQAIEEGAKSHQ